LRYKKIENMKHLFTNQFNWLRLYCMQPDATKHRRLYLSSQEVFDFLSKECQIIKVEKKNNKDIIHFYYSKYNVSIRLYPTYIILDGMIVLLTKETEKENKTN